MRRERGTWGLRESKSADVTCSGSLHAVPPTLTYGTTQHLPLELGQTFAPATSSRAAHSWKSRFLAGKSGRKGRLVAHSVFGQLPVCFIWLYCWKPTRQENATATLCKNPPWHTCGQAGTCHTHHLSPSGGAKCWAVRGEKKETSQRYLFNI